MPSGAGAAMELARSCTSKGERRPCRRDTVKPLSWPRAAIIPQLPSLYTSWPAGVHPLAAHKTLSLHAASPLPQFRVRQQRGGAGRSGQRLCLRRECVGYPGTAHELSNGKRSPLNPAGVRYPADWCRLPGHLGPWEQHSQPLNRPDNPAGKKPCVTLVALVAARPWAFPAVAADPTLPAVGAPRLSGRCWRVRIGRRF